MPNKYFLTLVLFLAACSKSNNSSSELTDQLIASQWAVHYYYDTADETSQFSGFIFTFSNNGIIKGVNGSTIFNGTWSVQKKSDGTLVLLINFSSVNPVQLLSYSWKVTDNNGTLLQLANDDVSGNKTLHFIRQ